MIQSQGPALTPPVELDTCLSALGLPQRMSAECESVRVETQSLRPRFVQELRHIKSLLFKRNKDISDRGRSIGSSRGVSNYMLKKHHWLKHRKHFRETDLVARQADSFPQN